MIDRIPLRRHALALATLALMASSAAWADEGDAPLGIERAVTLPEQANGKPPVWAGKAHRQGVVAVANPYAAEAGARMLEMGGNAIDAAVAIVYALNVVEPQSAGIGGGGFMMVHLAANGQTFAIDTREKAPALATRTMFVGVPNASLQGVAVGVPGMVRGTAQVLATHGRLSLAQVLQPAIELAENGFAATPRYAAVSCNARSRNSPESEAFFCPGGAAPVLGSLVKNQPLADTLKLIAQHGPDCFYKLMPEKGCDIARGILEGQSFAKPGLLPGGTLPVPGKGGSMTYADLEAYQPATREPTSGTYRGYVIKAMSPPSSGGLTLIQMLKMLERFPLGDAGQGFGFGSVKTATAMADAMRIAFADRSIWMGDADFVNVPGVGLLNATYAGARCAAIVPGSRLNPNPVPGNPLPFNGLAAADSGRRFASAVPVDGPGETTTHLSVVDQHGNLVSYTNTIEASHGIGVFAGYRRDDGSFKSHGFLLNNELTDFNLNATTNTVTGARAAA
jgi:gamma-glutamyltranspeptidase / glutathione hydrolase